MPDKLADHRQRVSFADDIEAVEQIRKIAEAEGKTLTDVYAEATRFFLEHKAKKQKNKK
jgi:hypothetical protein